jgi:tetratricopeptide (TPR) repeat protein
MCQNPILIEIDMRRPPRSFIFAVAVVAHALLACKAAADGVGSLPSPRIDIAQAPAGAAQAPLAELLARAEALSLSGKPLDAYQILASEEDTYIGVIEFDYALGRAALDAGRPDKATLAFSRVLALDPSHAGALIDTGRAYLALGDFARARAMFQALLAFDPPPAMRAQLQAYLAQAEPKQAEAKLPVGSSYQGYLAATLGRSTNVNQSPAQSSIFVPAIGSNFELSNQNVKKGDGFAAISGGVEGAKVLDGPYSLIFGSEFVERKYFHESEFDIGGVNLRLGIAAAMGAHLARFQELVGRDFLGGSASRDLEMFAFDYMGPLATDTQLLVSAQAGRLRYDSEELKIFDANFVTWGLGAARKIAEQSTAFLIFSTGNQNDVGDNPSGDKRLLGVRIGAETAIQPRWKLTGNAAWERGQYNRVDESFLTERRDFRWIFEAALQYALERNLFLRFGIAHADQRSNIPIYEYTRSEWWLMLRREFP